MSAGLNTPPRIGAVLGIGTPSMYLIVLLASLMEGSPLSLLLEFMKG